MSLCLHCVTIALLPLDDKSQLAPLRSFSCLLILTWHEGPKSIAWWGSLKSMKTLAVFLSRNVTPLGIKTFKPGLQM